MPTRRFCPTHGHCCWSKTSTIETLPRIPWMIGVDRPAVHIGADGVASVFFRLDGGVVVLLADALMIDGVDEQCPVALVRLAMVHRCGQRRLALRQAALA